MKKQEISYTDTFPTILRKLMEERKTTQKELAEYCNVRAQSISLYANGETQPTPQTLVNISRFFDVSVDYLLTGVSSRNTDVYNNLGLTETTIEFFREAKAKSLRADNALMDIMSELNMLLSDRDFHTFLDDVIFKTVMIRAEQQEVNDNPDCDEKLEFHIWQLQEYVRKFIYNQLQKRGIPIE